MTGETTPPLLRRLGLPGLFDVHTHFMPPQVMRKVRAQFDGAGPLIGRPWPIHYRADDETLVAALRALGVRRFTALPYAHRPAMAEWLNAWAEDFAARVPEALLSATVYPDDDAPDYVARRLAAGVQVWKVHVQVGGFSVLDPRLDEVWPQIAEAGVPVVLHAGSGPVPTEFTGPAPVAELLRRQPGLPLVIAHAGAPEYADFLALAERHDEVRLDTTMVFTDFFDDLGGSYPPALLPRLAELGLAGRVMLGSDFPNIPYPYAHQLDALERLGLGDDWLRAVCWSNGSALFGPTPVPG